MVSWAAFGDVLRTRTCRPFRVSAKRRRKRGDAGLYQKHFKEGVVGLRMLDTCHSVKPLVFISHAVKHAVNNQDSIRRVALPAFVLNSGNDLGGEVGRTLRWGKYVRLRDDCSRLLIA